MPVIGRLDRQVEDVLITPVRERRRQADTEPHRPKPAAGEADALSSPADAVPSATPTEAANDEDEARKPSPRDDERQAPRDELPVWLL
jgi:hypothetical protein